MDKIFTITQLIIAAVIFLCVIASVICHIVLGHITSIFGFIVSFVFIALSWVLIRISYKELRENR
ncbi:hypothetical protein QVO32_02985 [Bacteroides gallinaceum]|jgi:hypothetical protein|uniref:hypothetical protein n=1 Tax=Bacteroides gallinaceum TaxID=1462571 RepID=UPI0025AB0E8C|nr:hypothetical protein [Bacteroides gallinaceum]MDN0078376.1 hypothetical protein [Bacteroides gallinaceum]